MSLRQRILDIFKVEGKKMSMQELYTKFPDIAQTTAQFKEKTVEKGGITCHICKRLINEIKSVRM